MSSFFESGLGPLVIVSQKGCHIMLPLHVRAISRASHNKSIMGNQRFKVGVRPAVAAIYPPKKKGISPFYFK